MAKAWLILFLVGASGVALADMYKCTDDSGHVTYSNVSAKNCKRLISAAEERAASRPSGVVATPAGFPRVDGAVQKARDDDRRRILESELSAEQHLLDDARQALTEQEGRVEPEERNVAQRCQSSCSPGANGTQVCKRVCTPVVPQGVNQAKVDERLKPFRDRVTMHERNIDALQKELGDLR